MADYSIDKNGTVALVVRRGEKLRPALEKVLRQENIKAGSLSGIGAFQDPELGYFNIKTSEYRQQVLPGFWEVTSLTGNIADLNGEPFVHMHINLAGEDFAVRGGHFVDATVAVTAEIFITPFFKPIVRQKDPELELTRWTLPQ